jgi:hypothetical protein
MHTAWIIQQYLGLETSSVILTFEFNLRSWRFRYLYFSSAFSESWSGSVLSGRVRARSGGRPY